MVAETPQIETERLVLRRWDVAGDLDAYAAICGDPEVMRYIGLDRVVSVHAVANDPSGNVLQKIGMHVDQDTVYPKNGRTVRVYAIDRPATR